MALGAKTAEDLAVQTSPLATFAPNSGNQWERPAHITSANQTLTHVQFCVQTYHSP